MSPANAKLGPVARRIEAGRVQPSSGNIFADLNLPHAAELDACVRLAVALNHVIAASGLSYAAVARMLGIDRSSALALKRYKLQGISQGELLGYLTALGCDVEIRIGKPRRRAARSGRLTVSIQ